MILKRFYNDKLAQASYLVGCPASGEAIVIDPNRHIDQYIEAAEDEGLNLVGVTETHIHADFLSGARELAKATGATLYLSDEGDENWKYAYADEPNVRLIRHGDTIQAGAARLDVLHTPGHTPEHVSFLLTDEAASPEPLGLFSGDFVFVGDVGRPDLLEKAAGVTGTMEAGAKQLYESLRILDSLPDSLLIFPGHGAGSACGKGLGGVPVSSLGYERRAGWAFRIQDPNEFVRSVLEGQPDPPKYFKEMKRMNKMGPAILGGIRLPERWSAERLFEAMGKGGVTVLDVRERAKFAEGHVRGSLNIPEGRSFVNWAGWLVSYEQPIVLIGENEAQVLEAVGDLALIGLDEVIGWSGGEVLADAESAGRLETVEWADAASAKLACDNAEVILDVRTPLEYEAGHLPGAVNIPLGRLPDRIGELDPSKRTLVYCQSGGRSAIATSLLLQHGFRSVINLDGGYGGCVVAGQVAAAAR
ncbi:MAG: MBL fold metallo-hydrolase [Armatimonadetes bacterium]|nr:MAG: MBL fold metallo-hydrolase [Armatimonadota bacterium]